MFTRVSPTQLNDWLAQHPLSDFTLRAEEAEWNKVGFSFELLEF